MANAFQQGAFQIGAFQLAGGGSVTDTDVLRLPIDCVLAGQQPYKDRGRTWEIPKHRTSTRVGASSTPARRIRGAASSFTSRTNSRGYD